MKVTGFTLSAEIQRHEIARDAASEKFKESVRVFPGEIKPTPASVDDEIVKHDRAVAMLQAAQARFNAEVEVEPDVSLAEAIKVLGVALRRAKRWRLIAAPEKRERYYREDPSEVRAKDNVYAQPAVTREEAAKLAADALAQVQRLRSQIAIGNAKEIDLPVNPVLFD